MYLYFKFNKNCCFIKEKAQILILYVFIFRIIHLIPLLDGEDLLSLYESIYADFFFARLPFGGLAFPPPYCS